MTAAPASGRDRKVLSNAIARFDSVHDLVANKEWDTGDGV